MKYKLYSIEKKQGPAWTLHLQPAPVDADAKSFPAGLTWSKLWQASPTIELQMDVPSGYSDSLTLGDIYILQ